MHLCLLYQILKMEQKLLLKKNYHHIPTNSTSSVPGSSNIFITFTNSPPGKHLALDFDSTSTALVVTSFQTTKESQQWHLNDGYLENGNLVADYSGSGSEIKLASKSNGKPTCQQFYFKVRLICWAVCIENVTIMMYSVYNCVLVFFAFLCTKLI